MRPKDTLRLASPVIFLAACGVGVDSGTTTTTLPAPQPDIVAWGDSLTAGGEGNINTGDYPDDLAKLLARTVHNEGVGGDSSTQIGVRQGAIPTTATVAGGSIPASGSVAVTFPAGYEPVTSLGPQSGTTGTLLGVHGTVTYTLNGLLFTRDSAGSAVAAPSPAPFIVDTPYANDLPVFWEGRNNWWVPSQVQSDIAAQVATVKASNFGVISIINMNVASEWKTGNSYQEILNLNSTLASTYGSHYIDVRSALVSSYNPSLVTDVSDYNHDEIPTSLRAIYGSGTLVNAVGTSDTTLSVRLVGTSPTPGEILTIDTGASAENVQIASVSGNTVTVVRNFGGNDTSHPAGAPVIATDPIHLNADGYQIVANTVAARLAGK